MSVPQILEFLKIGGSWFTAIAVWASVLTLLLLLLIYRKRVRIFTREVRTELVKASWPWEPKEKGMKKYKELVDSTLIVVIAMLLMSGYVAFWDFVMVNIVGALTK